MLQLSALILVTVSLYLSLKEILNKRISKIENDYRCKESEFDASDKKNTGLKAENLKLAESLEETIALYEITKDMRKTLDEDQIFHIFKEQINRLVKVNDCLFIKKDTDLAQYKKHTALPLNIGRQMLGYLLVDGIEERDKDKFQILAQQFLAGIRGAYLFKQVQELTITDSLTGIFNRRYFLERFSEEIKRAKKFKLKFAFLMMDIDNFKSFNDNYGHLVGDAILKEITKVTKGAIREIDFMGRYGGEELSIVLTETDKGRAYLAGERIRQAIDSRQFRVYDEKLRVTVSIGVASFPADAAEISPLIEKADQALYLAKQTGKNKVCVY